MRARSRLTPDLLMRDPYLLDFLGLQDTYLEDDLEAAIVREMEGFLLELGAGFSFVARQKRIQLDGDDFYLDLLFYNRKLKRLIAIELKVGEFKAEYKGQMELYLRWLDRYEREPDELPPLGIILCTGKKSEQIELLEMDRSGIHVAEYLTACPRVRFSARNYTWLPRGPSSNWSTVFAATTPISQPKGVVRRAGSPSGNRPRKKRSHEAPHRVRPRLPAAAIESVCDLFRSQEICRMTTLSHASLAATRRLSPAWTTRFLPSLTTSRFATVLKTASRVLPRRLRLLSSTWWALSSTIR